jgi:hypothetical protein
MPDVYLIRTTHRDGSIISKLAVKRFMPVHSFINSASFKEADNHLSFACAYVGCLDPESVHRLSVCSGCLATFITVFGFF